MRKICVVTGTRAEYGLLKPVMDKLQQCPSTELQLIVTGMHLSPDYGLTVRQIETDGFCVDRKVEMLLSSDTVVAITKSMGLGTIGFADAFNDLRPDVVVLLGDRYEIFAAATAALVARIPIAHLHGGEITEGAFDEAIRHSITKMSHFHFVANEDYRRRVVQLGEHPDRVFHVGGLGVDAIPWGNLLNKSELESQLGLRFGEKNLLVTFHPVTLEEDSARAQITELLAALEDLHDTCLIFTMPNSDTGSRVISEMIQQYVSQHERAWAFVSLGQQRYLSCMRWVDAVVGNSSSGLAEAPSFRKATINIGDRQRGRLKATSVIDCEASREVIRIALKQIYSAEFQEQLQTVKNPYGEGGASHAIVDILSKVSLTGVLKKRFYDLNSRSNQAGSDS